MKPETKVNCKIELLTERVTAAEEGGFLSWLQDTHFAAKSAVEFVFFGFQIKSGLKVDPELLGKAEIQREPQGRVRADRPLAQDYLVDTARRHTDIRCEPVL